MPKYGVGYPKGLHFTYSLESLQRYGWNHSISSDPPSSIFNNIINKCDYWIFKKGIILCTTMVFIANCNSWLSNLKIWDTCFLFMQQ